MILHRVVIRNPRDSEEHLHAELAIPYQRRDELFRNALRVRDFREQQASIDMVHQHEKDRQPAKHVDAIDPLPDCGNQRVLLNLSLIRG